MDKRLKELQEELQQSRSDLRWQKTRYHHLISALTVKLEQREVEVKSLSNLRDAQLNNILCALYNLEARLRREQRSIRAQLGSRDAIIREQQLEIARLKKIIEPQQRLPSPPESLQSFQSSSIEYDHVKPDLISSLGIWNKVSKKCAIPQEKQPDYYLSSLNNNHSSLTSSLSTDISESTVSTVINTGKINKSELDSAADEAENTLKVSNNNSSNFNNSDVSAKVSVLNKNLNHDYNDDDFNRHDLENGSLQFISELKEDELESAITTYEIDESRPPSVDYSIPESADSFTVVHNVSKISETIAPPKEFSENESKNLPPSALLHEMQAQSKSGKNQYRDNPVLECVNQILLRDQEEFLEEQRALRIREFERNKNESRNFNNNRSREDLTTLSPIKENPFSPNKHLNQCYQNKPCLVSSKQLKLVGNISFEEDQNSDSFLNNDTSTKKSPQSKSNMPPALPPKPLKLLNIKPSNDFKQENPNKNKPISTHLSINQQKFELKIRPNLEIIGNSSPALPEPSSDSELYVISNSALDDDILQQIQGKNMKNCLNIKKALSPVAKKPNEIITHASVHFPAGKKKESSNNPNKLICSNNLSNSVEKRKSNNGSNKSPAKNNKTVSPVIKVASPVSSLLATVESITNETNQNDNGVSKSVLQIVQRFEHLGNVEKHPVTVPEEDEEDCNALQKNFEEFRLDECDMDALCTTTEEDSRAKGDGAENRLNMKIKMGSTVVPSDTNVSYENFLEATGLSQKSIMTPSRMFSNHRSVLKPKDVKHRSKVKAAATVTNNTVRYWTEPYL